jgi:predicted GTPase
VPVSIGHSKLLLIDTPGFDDSERTDTEILTEIARILSAQYELGVQLKGVIYIHRITDIRYARSSVKTFEIFKKICGD